MKETALKMVPFLLLTLLITAVTSPNVVGREKDNRVTNEGVVKSLENKAATWMYGTHMLLQENKPIYALRSEDVPLEDFEGENVQIEGTLVHNGLEGGPPLVEVKSLKVKDGSPPTVPPTFKVTNLSIKPNEVKPGENVEISVYVKNIGERKGTQSVKITIEGEIRKKKISLNPGKTSIVTFKISKEKKGIYTVQAGEFLENLRITKAKTGKGEGKTELPLTWITGVVAVFVALTIGILVWQRPNET